MGKWLELPLLSAWVTEGRGSSSVQRAPLQMCTFIIPNQTNQVRGAGEMESSEKADKWSSRALGLM